MSWRRRVRSPASTSGRVRATGLAVSVLVVCSVLAWAPVASPHGLGGPADAAGGGDPSRLAPEPPPQRPGQRLPMEPARTIEFETDEVTWLSPDLSPDGRAIAFDVLGDLYVVPFEGGEARRLTSGMGFDTQPAWSPDGTRIAFVSDRSGAENLWVMRADGSEPLQLSFRDDHETFVTPAWSADGRSIYVTRHRSDLNQHELWRFPADGGDGELAIPVRATPDAPAATWRSVTGPAASRDGRWLYYAQHVGSFSYEALPEWTIVRRELATGRDETLVSAPRGPRPDLSLGTAFRPAISPDGRTLVYAARRDGRTGLRVLDLETRADRWLAWPAQQDQAMALPSQDLMPRHAFTPDGRGLVVGAGGRLRHLNLATGESRVIPIRVAVSVGVGPQLRRAVRHETGPVRARLIQAPVQSPDGRRLAFSALGRLYVMELRAGAKPRRLTSVEDGEFQPAWSPDGRHIVYVTWNAREGGHVWSVDARGGQPRRLTTAPAFYTSPAHAPDGRHVVALRSSHHVRMQSYMEYGTVRAAELVELPVDGGAARVVVAGAFGDRPHFGADPRVAYVNAGDGLDAVSLDSGERRRVTAALGFGWYFQEGLAAADALKLSPDGRWALAQVAQQLWLYAVPRDPRAVVDLTRPSVPLRRLTDVGADFFDWSADGRQVTWAIGATFHRRALADVLPTTALPARPPGARGAERFDVRVEVPRDEARGALVLRGATAITMRGQEVVKDADVVVVDGRIAGVGPRGTVPVPRGATVHDVAGRWVLPGFVDTHDHLADVRRAVLDAESWGPAATLAYGVTTTFDPSPLTIDMLAYEDLVDAGRMVGPRIHSTGPAVYSFNRFASLDEVRAVLRRYAEHYRTYNLKQYRAGNRRVRQWIAQAAHELGIVPTTEGALSFKLALTQILDGYAGHEHALPAVPLYRDVVELLARTRVSYTTTLQIGNGGPGAQDWFVTREAPHDDPKLGRFYPHYVLDVRTLDRRWRDDREYLFARVAESAARVQRAGGLVGIGTHGEMPGLGFHWEMAAHAAGGMTPHEVLRAATLGSAETIARHSDVGSLEAGKAADLVVLDRDPLADLANARAIRYVMKAGRLYEAPTLDEVWPQVRPLRPRWFDPAREPPVPALDAR